MEQEENHDEQHARRGQEPVQGGFCAQIDTITFNSMQQENDFKQVTERSQGRPERLLRMVRDSDESYFKPVTGHVKCIWSHVAALLWLLLWAPNGLAGYTSIYVFGDSLSATAGSDMLPYPFSPGVTGANYWDGRFSNGQVWVEYLAALQGVPFDTNNNYSYFGGASPLAYNNIVAGNYFPPADAATSLYIIWSACSDCFVLSLFDFTNSWTVPMLGGVDIAYAMESVSNSVTALYGQGVRTLILPNSVDVTKVPFFVYGATNLLTSDTTLLAQVITNIQAQIPIYNAALAATVTQLRSQYPDLTLYAPDFYGQFNFIYSHPDIYGVTNVAIDALEDPAVIDKSFTGPGANHMFWDYLHPTTMVHAAVANYVQQIISPMRINAFERQGSSLRFDLTNLPLGRTGLLESTTNILSPGAWTTCAPVVVTGTTQTVFISTNGMGTSCFYRLDFPR